MNCSFKKYVFDAPRVVVATRSGAAASPQLTGEAEVFLTLVAAVGFLSGVGPNGSLRV